MKNEYNTKQKQILTDYFSENSNRQFSVNEVARDVGEKGIGKSTVYRQISNMCNEGILKRFRGKNGKSVLYQYLGANTHCDKHFHLKCTECGELIHLDCDSIMRFTKHIDDSHGFRVNIADTVLYGVCKKCSRKGVNQ